MFAYLDNSATTKPCAAAVQAIQTALTEAWGNPSSVHHFGVEAEHQLKQARKAVAQALGAAPERVFFTSGGTEADNWAIFSAAERMGKRGKHIITTAIEHHAVLHPMKKLAERGFEVTYLQPDENGCITLDALKQALRPDTILVSVMMVNNETGAVMPIEKMARLTHRHCPNALFHTDAVQGFFKVPFQAKTLGADMISVSGHKIHAAKGIGALYVREGLSLPPYLHGGGQERNYRSGTEALPLIAGFGAACSNAWPNVHEDIAHQCALRDEILTRLDSLEGVQRIGPAQACHIINCCLPGIPSQNTINILQEHGVYVSAGSACSKGHRSHVLEAMGVAPACIDSSIRISLCRDTTQEELEALYTGLADVLRRCRR